MTNITFKTLALTGAALFTLAAPVHANDLIDNSAFGFVQGDILQDTDFMGAGNNLNIEVGSITAKGEARNNNVMGEVSGQIRQEARGYDNELNVQVGSLNARDAFLNTAEGRVNGDINQFVEGDGLTADIKVGNIDAGDGDAFNNKAMGYVDGDVTQVVSHSSKANLRVGSISH